MRSILIPPLLLVLAASAFASDGVLEINQTCAVQTGCFSGDTAGYPVTIDGSAGRSYLLTGDLSRVIFEPGETLDVNFIEISADDVTLDLGGFRIFCADVGAASCGGSGSGVVASVGPPVTGTSVKNGSIRGMAGAGVFLDDRAEVTHLRAQSNRASGITVGSGSTVSGNIASENGGSGIVTGTGSTVSGNTVSENGDDGIFVGGGSTVSGNTAFENEDDGIFAAGTSTVSGNTAILNRGDGIQANLGSSLQRNTVRANTDFGLNPSEGSAYRENVITQNGTGGVAGGVNLGDNYCSGNLVASADCP